MEGELVLLYSLESGVWDGKPMDMKLAKTAFVAPTPSFGGGCTTAMSRSWKWFFDLATEYTPLVFST
jgi:hypothetical protein